MDLHGAAAWIWLKENTKYHFLFKQTKKLQHFFTKLFNTCFIVLWFSIDSFMTPHTLEYHSCMPGYVHMSRVLLNLPNSSLELKTDRPHSKDYSHNPPEYRQTGKSHRLVIVIPCSKPVGNCTWQAEPLIWKHTHTQTDGRYQFHYLPASLKLRGR